MYRPHGLGIETYRHEFSHDRWVLTGDEKAESEVRTVKGQGILPCCL